MVNRMKKISVLLSLVFVVCLFTGCGTGNSGATTTEPTVETTEEKASDVTISIKKDSVVDAEDFIQGMKDYGAEVNNKEDSDSFFFIFSSIEYKKLLDDKHKECVDKFKEFEDNQEHYIDKVEYDDNFRNLTISVNKALYDSDSAKSDGYIVAATALSYQLYINEAQHTNVKLIYSGTEEVVSTFSLPMNFSIE